MLSQPHVYKPRRSANNINIDEGWVLRDKGYLSCLRQDLKKCFFGNVDSSVEKYYPGELGQTNMPSQPHVNSK